MPRLARVLRAPEAAIYEVQVSSRLANRLATIPKDIRMPNETKVAAVDLDVFGLRPQRDLA